mgnify:CR=1 FL=1
MRMMQPHLHNKRNWSMIKGGDKNAAFLLEKFRSSPFCIQYRFIGSKTTGIIIACIF